MSRQKLSLSAHGDCLLEETFPLLALSVLPHHGAFFLSGVENSSILAVVLVGKILS